MDIKAIEANYGIKVKSGKQVVARLQAGVRRYEKKYDITSEQMDENIRRKIMIETPEITRWMSDYHLIRCIKIVTERRNSGPARLEQSEQLSANL